MAPKPPGGARKSSKGAARKGGTSKSTTTHASSPARKPKSTGKRPPSKQVKTKPGAHSASRSKKKQRVYSDKELDLPPLNMITPVGVQKPKGKKKGKIFVDDRESMMTILAMVNAEKEGQIESKMMKARQMEEIREARRQEAESRQERKNEKLEETKKSLKKGKGRVPLKRTASVDESVVQPSNKQFKKRVSFA